MIDLKPEELETVKSILKQWIPGKKVVAFGSRVNGTAKPFSDLDLAIYSDQALPRSVMAHLRDAFSASNLRIKVDLVETSDIDENFLKIIESRFEKVQ